MIEKWHASKIWNKNTFIHAVAGSDAIVRVKFAHDME